MVEGDAGERAFQASRLGQETGGRLEMLRVDQVDGAGSNAARNVSRHRSERPKGSRREGGDEGAPAADHTHAPVFLLSFQELERWMDRAGI